MVLKHNFVVRRKKNLVFTVRNVRSLGKTTIYRRISYDKTMWHFIKKECLPTNLPGNKVLIFVSNVKRAFRNFKIEQQL